MSSAAPLVLYVDDEHANRIVFEYALRAHFHVMTVESGAAALPILDEREVAVLVTDIRMPGLDGISLLRMVRDHSPQTIRMVLTAYSDLDPILRAINEGLVARYIIKPWSQLELIQVLRWATQAWSLGRDSAALNRRLLETERLITLGSLSGAIARDLEQPLSSLVLDAKRLERLANALPHVRKLLDGAPLSSAEHDDVAHLVDELADVAFFIRAGTLNLQDVAGALGRFLDPATAGSADPVAVVRHAMSVCHDLAAHSHSHLTYEGAPSLPRVQMAFATLTQVLINVLTNALHAVAERHTPGGNVVVRSKIVDRLLVLEIADDGVGMSPEVLARVGTPFFTTRPGATGLGIAQCQRLIGAAGGRFQIESEVSAGTKVTISVPFP